MFRTDSAEVYLNQALNIYESHYGSSNVKVLEIKDELARLMIRTDRVEVGFISCLPCYKLIITILRLLIIIN